MKLHDNQINELKESEWDPITNIHGNVHIVNIFKEDGKIFNEVCEILQLTASTTIKLAVIATKEDTEE